MNLRRAADLPLIPLPTPTWYRAVQPALGRLPPRVSIGPTRFNPGRGALRLVYFARDDRVARFEARDILGSFFHASVPAAAVRHVVAEYNVALSDEPIVDAREPNLPTVDTTLQEMTGDWFTYPRGSGVDAPTQQLAVAIHNREGHPLGLIAPSARNPLANNLILFADRLPRQSISLVGIQP